MHKFLPRRLEGIGDKNDSTRMTPEGLDRLDYFAGQLQEHGVYFGWSHTYGFHVGPGDRARLLGLTTRSSGTEGNTYAFINFAEDVQDLMIEMVVKLLKHQNPYTGQDLRPGARAVVHRVAERGRHLFLHVAEGIQRFPTYRKLLRARFAEWLKARYGTQERLAAAWAGALKTGERLSGGNGSPRDQPLVHGRRRPAQATGGARQRMLDNAACLHFTQNKLLYAGSSRRFATPDTRAPWCGSPWQAPAMLPHYYNLRSDDLVGYIDRHDYFGGGLPTPCLPSPAAATSPAACSRWPTGRSACREWIHVYPSLYSAEGPVLVAAYGMGLQGWDASVRVPGHVAPALRRPRDRLASLGRLGSRRAHAIGPVSGPGADDPTAATSRRPPSSRSAASARTNLETAEFDFSDTVRQEGDIKTFTGWVPAESLAAGQRPWSHSSNKTTPSTLPEMAKYKQGTVITSATGQLKWDTAGGGLVTIDTPGTQGYVGFAQGRKLAFTDLSIQPATPYASILITAADPGANLAGGKRVLISAVARNSNKGFRVLALDNRTIVNNGTPPIMLEPVKAAVRFAHGTIAAVNVLDQDGRLSGRTLPVTGNAFTIDSAKDDAIYYEVRFQR